VKRALLERTALQYQGASGSHKQRILARFMTVTGSVRKYVMWVLNHTEEVLQTADAPPQRYGSEVRFFQLFGEVVGQILLQTNCYPFLIQALCSQLVDDLNVEKGQHVELSHVVRACYRAGD
jgi:hypothetical protein